MSLWSRVLLLLSVKSRATLERAEDPRELLGYVDEQQQELLRRVREGLREVAISRRQLDQQVRGLQARVPRLEDQARRALAAGREDLARLALERKQRLLEEAEHLQTQAVEVGREEDRLSLAEQQLGARIEEYRQHRRAMSARYTAAEAQVKVQEALSGVSRDSTGLGMALGRAEEKIERMLARASAVDALVEGGTLALIAGPDDAVERELRLLASGEAVEAELADLRSEQWKGGAHVL